METEYSSKTSEDQHGALEQTPNEVGAGSNSISIPPRIFPKKGTYTVSQMQRFITLRQEQMPEHQKRYAKLIELKKIRENKDYVLTVFLITYNHQDSISNALDSVLEQKTTYPYIIKILDDRSFDNTSAICLDYALKYPEKIEYCPEPINSGMINITAHIRNVKTKYFAVLDGDDRWSHPEKVQRALDFLEANPEYIGYTHDTCYVNTKNNTRASYTHDVLKRDNPPSTLTFENYFYAHVSSRIHRNVVDFKKDFPNLRLRDIFVFFICMDRGPYYYCDEIMSEYVFNGLGVWSSQNKQEKDYSYNYRRYILNVYTNYRHEKVFRKATNSKGLNIAVKVFGKRLGWYLYTIYRKYLFCLKALKKTKNELNFIEYKHRPYPKMEQKVRDIIYDEQL